MGALDRDPPEELVAPQRAVIVETTMTDLSVFYTVIDLETNELLTLRYSLGGRLTSMVRSGIVVDPATVIGRR